MVCRSHLEHSLCSVTTVCALLVCVHHLCRHHFPSPSAALITNAASYLEHFKCLSPLSLRCLSEYTNFADTITLLPLQPSSPMPRCTWSILTVLSPLPTRCLSGYTDFANTVDPLPLQPSSPMPRRKTSRQASVMDFSSALKQAAYSDLMSE